MFDTQTKIAIGGALFFVGLILFWIGIIKAFEINYPESTKDVCEKHWKCNNSNTGGNTCNDNVISGTGVCKDRCTVAGKDGRCYYKIKDGLYQDAWKKQLNSWTDEVAKNETNPKKIYEKVIAKAKAWKKEQYVEVWWKVWMWFGCYLVCGICAKFIFDKYIRGKY